MICFNLYEYRENPFAFDKTFFIFFCRITTFADYVSDLGHPYVWVQKLGGLQFSSDGAQVCVALEMFEIHFAV